MPELATVKSAFPSVVMHSEAPEFHSLFCTMYAPPATGAVCSAQRLDVAARAWAAPAVSPPAAATATRTAAPRRARPGPITIARCVPLHRRPLQCGHDNPGGVKGPGESAALSGGRRSAGRAVFAAKKFSPPAARGAAPSGRLSDGP